MTTEAHHEAAGPEFRRLIKWVVAADRCYDWGSKNPEDAEALENAARRYSQASTAWLSRFCAEVGASAFEDEFEDGGEATHVSRDPRTGAAQP